MQNIKVSEGQTFIDIAMQYLGDALRADEIAVLNGMELSDLPAVGSDILVPDAAIEKEYVVKEFIERGVVPASDDSDLNGEILDGIDYWIIEEDFVVQ